MKKKVFQLHLSSVLQSGLMPTGGLVESLPSKAKDSSRQRLRMIARGLVIALAVCQAWATRYVIDPDGTAYADIARAWLKGDWIHALNSYWSPLYIWLLTFAFAIFSPSIHWQIPLMHAVDLVGFLSALAAWEWLTSEWKSWRGPSAQPMLTDLTGYCVVAWAGLRLTGLGWFNSADILVMTLLIAATAILVRVRRGVAANSDFAFLGVVLGVGFLAKTAFAAIIPVFLIVLALLSTPGVIRRVSITAVAVFAIAAPFIAAISIAKGHFTIGDSGRLNYSWHVSGISVEGYKDGQYLPGPEISHPIRVLMQHPRILSFEQHLVGTLPIHSDVSWWCDGYPVRFNRARELMILQSNINFSMRAFARCPAILLALICLPFGGFEMAKRFGQAWFVWIPSVIFAVTYCLVFADFRYFAGSYSLIGFALITAAWNVRLPMRIALVSRFAIPLLAALLMGGAFRHMIPQFVGDITGRKPPLEIFNVQIAENMRRQGLQSGDRVAIIGALLTAAHVGLEHAQIVAVIPERVYQNDTLPGRPIGFSFEKPDQFWSAGPQAQAHVLERFSKAGAKWVFADCVPSWADRAGWHVAGGAQVFRSGDLPYVYFQKLSDLEEIRQKYN